MILEKNIIRLQSIINIFLTSNYVRKITRIIVTKTMKIYKNCK